MTTPVTPSAHAIIPAAQVLGLKDPILQELWAHKAIINAQAHYNIEELVQRLQSRRNEIQLVTGTVKQH
jgi:hypothetical protein